MYKRVGSSQKMWINSTRVSNVMAALELYFKLYEDVAEAKYTKLKLISTVCQATS